MADMFQQQIITQPDIWDWGAPAQTDLGVCLSCQ